MIAKFENWLRRQLYTAREEGRCKKLVVKHVQAGSKGGNEVDSINVPQKVDDDFIISVINQVESMCESDAHGMGGIQSYAVLAFYENDPEKSLGRFTFRITGDDDEDEGDVSHSEPPNRVGITSQLMRHNEAIMKVGTLATGQVVSVMQRTIARQEEMIEKLISERLETFHLIEELQTQKHDRDLSSSREAMKQQMIRETFEKVTLLAPVIVNKLAGKKMLPERKTAQEIQLKELMNTLSAEQMEKLQQVLRPEQLMSVLSMVEQFAKEDMADSEKRQPATALAKIDGGKL